MKNFYRQLFTGKAALLVAVATTLLGCSRTPDGPPRVAIEGQVTFRGKPLEKGSILFIPVGDTTGPKAGAVIESGEYRLSSDRGPVVGRLRVEIRGEKEFGYDITEPTESVRHIGEPMPAETIPLEFNERSTIEIETRTSGENAFDFHLPMRP